MPHMTCHREKKSVSWLLLKKVEDPRSAGRFCAVSPQTLSSPWIMVLAASTSISSGSRRILRVEGQMETAIIHWGGSCFYLTNVEKPRRSAWLMAVCLCSMQKQPQKTNRKRAAGADWYKNLSGVAYAHHSGQTRQEVSLILWSLHYSLHWWVLLWPFCWLFLHRCFFYSDSSS